MHGLGHQALAIYPYDTLSNLDKIMKHSFFIILAALAVSACATPPLPIERAPASVSLLRGAPMDRIRETTSDTTIRAFAAVQDADGQRTRVEIDGAQCTLESDHLRARVVTPQRVSLPRYDQNRNFENRGVPPTILVRCSHNGQSGNGLIAAEPGQIVASNSGIAIVDLMVLAGSAAAASSADWRYASDVEVMLE
jgi:hypothetical protein